MTVRVLGWMSLGLFAAASVPFWLRMTLIISTRGSGYVWANLAFLVLGVLTVIVSVAFFGGWLLHLTRAWSAGPRWALALLASAALLAGEAFVFLFACVGINFVGQ